MKPMLPTLTFDTPSKPDWFYEVKYDGFRAFLEWDSSGIKLISRNGKDLLPQFPEIENFLLQNEKLFSPSLPIILDGELVLLENIFKADFSGIQKRGRMKSIKNIEEQAKKSPCRLLVFDILHLSGKQLFSAGYLERKKELAALFDSLHFDKKPNPDSEQLLQFVEPFKDFKELWEKVVLYDGEGIVAKQKGSPWEEGKRTTSWLKYKNFKHFNCFITDLDKTNQYIGVGVYKGTEVVRIGHILFGLKPDEKQALLATLKQNSRHEDSKYIYVDPAICLEVKYLELYENQLREPHFERFRFDLTPSECTYDKFVLQKKNLPKEFEITHPEKPLWQDKDISKMDYINYLLEISPYMLPFLKDRLLTVIRFPHGMFGEPFYQKNCPDYAPDFVKTVQADDIEYILCNNLETLLWLGNQLAIEFHIPFQTIKSSGPSEIVFDLDPPSKEAFQLAVHAAILIKEVLDELNLTGFIKTSGNKGLQVYIPLPENTYSYDDTRLFTSFIAEYLISKKPDSFTVERLKKNRQGRLYVDYVQHSEGKTIVSPFSLRGNERAGIATPLFWEEINLKMDPNDYTFITIKKRMDSLGNPFKNYFTAKDSQPFAPILKFLRQNKGITTRI